MSVKGFLKEHNIITGGDDQPDAAISGPGSRKDPGLDNAVQVTSRPSVASLLSRRRDLSADSTVPPPIPVSSASPSSAKPAVVADEEVVAHFRKTADTSQASGYTEFFHQLNVLSKHIHDDASLYAAALDSSGVDLKAIVRAIDDRTTIVRDEKEGSLHALDQQRMQEVSNNQARKEELASQMEHLQLEIAERQEKIRGLTSDQEQVMKKLAATTATYQHDADTIRVAADQVLTELAAQADRLRSLKGIN